MDQFFEKLLKLCKEHQDERQMAQFIRMTLPAINQCRENKSRFVAEFKDIIRISAPTFIPQPGPKKEMKEVVFTSADFEAPKAPPQVAPPVGIEVKGAAAKEVNPLEKEVLAVFDKGLSGAEDMGLDDFQIAVEGAGFSFKRKPKTVEDAWAAFEKYARKTLQI